MQTPVTGKHFFFTHDSKRNWICMLDGVSKPDQSARSVLPLRASCTILLVSAQCNTLRWQPYLPITSEQEHFLTAPMGQGLEARKFRARGQGICKTCPACSCAVSCALTGSPLNSPSSVALVALLSCDAATLLSVSPGLAV